MTKLEKTALHEVRHSIIAYLLGNTVIKISIIPSSADEGHCEYVNLRENTLHSLLIRLAPYVYDKKFTYNNLLNLKTMDVRNSVRELLSWTEKEFEALKIIIKGFLRDYKEQEKELVKILCKKKVIYCDEFEKIMES